MGEILNKYRRTGRTTRMLEYAKKLSKEGRAVYIMTADKIQESAFVHYLKNYPYPIKIESPGSLTNFDFQTMRLRGAHPNCIVLCDHYLLEKMYGHIIEAFHAYDKEEDNE